MLKTPETVLLVLRCPFFASVGDAGAVSSMAESTLLKGTCTSADMVAGWMVWRDHGGHKQDLGRWSWWLDGCSSQEQQSNCGGGKGERERDARETKRDSRKLRGLIS